MKNFVKFMVCTIAVVSAIAAIAFWVYHFLSVAEKRTKLVFKSDFSDDDTVIPEKVPEPDTTACDGAVCAVDMCMPY